jgi:Short C-terminal domain
MARTAVVAGTATAVSNRVSRRQAGRWAQQDQAAYGQPQYAEPQYAQPQYAPPPAAADPDDMIERLEKLGQLHESGVLTDEEFAAQKARILAT